ncbi:glycerol-3-phosphate dehydrogenase/oxidase [Caryophanon latum]|uniref:Glycerol-3-phosphate dehydrogenase n=1 Tax=Caryophanon latum TaxID=33977 RepID=A0A1C0YE78_9BACL|nr:glycerol-3-phosphate dehydrogenase/oxidase [Caryophanon latum]OCS85478.1 glycerol-3-phosphate dehydrogenase [Caryophanon latum]
MFSSKERTQLLQQMDGELYDVVVIGGGITGAGVALDAVTRGLKVALVDMQDFAEGTSSRSTKLVHGGLRYLKQAQIKEVAELGRERAVVYENAPHVTTPLWMLLPFYTDGTFDKATTALGLTVYDYLAGVKRKERKMMLSSDEVLARVPTLKKDGLVGGGMYVEYRTDDARLTIEVLKAAVMRGVQAVNYAKAVAIDEKNIAFTAVTIADCLTDATYKLKAKRVINAAGPWVDEVRSFVEKVEGKHLVLTKGVHVVIDAAHFPLQQPVYFDHSDGRMIFAIPRDNKVYVGTTDTFYNGDATKLVVDPEDRAYLLAAIQYMFPDAHVVDAHIESTWAGVRPLIHEEGKSPSDISRKDEIWRTSETVITIAGGKLTGYRKMAQKVVDVLVKDLEQQSAKRYGRCVTKHLPLSGGDLSGSRFFEQYVNTWTERGVTYGYSEEESERLVRMYGTNVEQVMSCGAEAGELPRALYAALRYSIEYEMTMTPADFFVRRTGMIYFDLPAVERYKEAVLHVMAEQLHYSDEDKEAHRLTLEAAIIVAKA